MSVNIKLKPKRLKSGKQQIRFTAKIPNDKPMTGYLLAEPNCTLKEVVDVIQKRIVWAGKFDSYHHAHLYSLNKKSPQSNIVII